LGGVRLRSGLALPALPPMVSGSMSGLIYSVKSLDSIALLTSTIVLGAVAVIAALLRFGAALGWTR